MKTRAIGAIIAIITAWILIVGGSIVKNFDEIVRGNQQLAELEWTFLCDGAYDEYEDIEEIDGSNYFIGVGSGEVEYHLIDETGKKIAGPYTNTEPLRDGYVRTEVEPTGVVIEDADGNNTRIVTEDLDVRGEQNYKVVRYGTIIGIAGISE